MAHASKFIERDSYRLKTVSNVDGVEATSVINDNDIITVLILNMYVLNRIILFPIEKIG